MPWTQLRKRVVGHPARAAAEQRRGKPAVQLLLDPGEQLPDLAQRDAVRRPDPPRSVGHAVRVPLQPLGQEEVDGLEVPVVQDHHVG